MTSHNNTNNTNNTNKKHKLIWLDLEMTGLDIKNDIILEIASIITDQDLNVLAKGPVFAINHPDEILDNMNDWCKKQHAKSGLVDRVKSSNVTMADAENKTLDFWKEWVKDGESPLCGNSVHNDRIFLAKYMPSLDNFLHYRHLDVSTLKLLSIYWYKKEFKKESKHIALDDIVDSIDELKFYRDHILVKY